ncbi:MAG: dephospho-CoA kinase [Pseudomonadota bacterium]
MLKIGLTGGIGSGKSTVSKIFQQINIPVIDADEIAHQLVTVGQPALTKIQQEYGSNILNPDGTLNRKQLKELIFSDDLQKQKLETILHPLIYQAIQKQINALNTPYCIICIPLLFETAMTNLVDRILVVDCPVEEQIKRLLKRDNMTIERIQSIIDSQVSRAFRKSMANDLLDNTLSNECLAQQIKKLHNQYNLLSNYRETSSQ